MRFLRLKFMICWCVIFAFISVGLAANEAFSICKSLAVDPEFVVESSIFGRMVVNMLLAVILISCSGLLGKDLQSKMELEKTKVGGVV